MPSLDSAYAQVDRGSEHLIELRQLHDEVCAVQAESTVVEFKLQATVPPGESVKAGEVRYPRPPVAIRIRIIAGETANCFRSALDYLVGQLAILDSGTRQEKTQFQTSGVAKASTLPKRFFVLRCAIPNTGIFCLSPTIGRPRLPLHFPP